MFWIIRFFTWVAYNKCECSHSVWLIHLYALRKQMSINNEGEAKPQLIQILFLRFEMMTNYDIYGCFNQWTTTATTKTTTTEYFTSHRNTTVDFCYRQNFFYFVFIVFLNYFMTVIWNDYFIIKFSIFRCDACVCKILLKGHI